MLLRRTHSSDVDKEAECVGFFILVTWVSVVEDHELAAVAVRLFEPGKNRHLVEILPLDCFVEVEKFRLDLSILLLCLLDHFVDILDGLAQTLLGSSVARTDSCKQLEKVGLADVCDIFDIFQQTLAFFFLGLLSAKITSRKL